MDIFKRNRQFNLVLVLWADIKQLSQLSTICLFKMEIHSPLGFL